MWAAAEASNDQIILATLTLLGTTIAILGYVIRNGGYAKTAAVEARAANAAVNNVGPGEHRLYDRIDQIAQKQAEFDTRWGNMPSGMDNSVSLTELLHNMATKIDDLQAGARIRTGRADDASADIRHLQREVIEAADKQAEFDDRWSDLPEGLDSTASLAETINAINARLGSIERAIANHVH